MLFFKIFFYFYNCFFLCILFALGVIFSRNPVYSIINLVACFICILYIYLLINVEYVALLLLIVYIGAVSILFLFVIMFLNLRLMDLYIKWYYYIYFGVLILLFFLFYLYNLNIDSLNILNHFFLGFSFFFRTVLNYVSYKNNLIFSDQHLMRIGFILYNLAGHYLIIVAIILLVSMLGSIVLVLIKTKNSSVEDISYSNYIYYNRYSLVRKFNLNFS